jgi:hypothetical protein
MGFGGPGQAQGEVRTGVIRSKTFTIEGNSINLLVGGGDYPNECYVALVDTLTGETLFRETGRNSDVMDRRYWDVRLYFGRGVYIEITDLSTATFGHICVDDIVESGDLLSRGGGSGSGGSGKRDKSNPVDALEPDAGSPARPRLLANTPNPFNPSTTVAFEIPFPARVGLQVFNAAGACVRTLVAGARPAGSQDVEWDGRDDAGRPVASGVYFARLAVDGVVVDTRKLALLK